MGFTTLVTPAGAGVGADASTARAGWGAAAAGLGGCGMGGCWAGATGTAGRGGESVELRRAAWATRTRRRAALHAFRGMQHVAQPAREVWRAPRAGCVHPQAVCGVLRRRCGPHASLPPQAVKRAKARTVRVGRPAHGRKMHRLCSYARARGGDVRARRGNWPELQPPARVISCTLPVRRVRPEHFPPSCRRPQFRAREACFRWLMLTPPHRTRCLA